MRVFVTGASGHIGGAVITELTGAGHQVVGLARSDKSAAVIEAAGAEVRRGDLDDLDGLRQAAAEADAVIHLAFKHDAMESGDFMGAVTADLAAVQAMGEVLEGTGKAFVGTGGTLMLAMAGIHNRPGTEEDVLPGGPRVDTENYVIGLADKGVRSSYVRLPPIVHSYLDLHGFFPTLVSIARQSGIAAYPGEGTNRWPSVDTRDAAVAYRLAVEKAPAGTRIHAVADEGIPFKEIAGAIGRNLDLPVQSAAPEHFSFLERFVVLDGPASSERTRRLLGWEPTHPGLIADIDEGHYFKS